MGCKRRRCRLSRSRPPCRVLCVTVLLHLVTHPLAAQQPSLVAAPSPVPPPAFSKSVLPVPVATSVTAAPAGSVAAMLARVVHDTTLANGLQVIVIENHATPLVTVEIVFRAGAFTQESGDQGVSRLYEQILFESYVGPNSLNWSDVMAKIGGLYGAEADDEAVRYSVTVPAAETEGAIRAVAELVRDPLFTQGRLDGERSVTVDGLASRRLNPAVSLRDQVNQRLWTTAWGRKDVMGDANTIGAVTLKRLDQIFHRYYVPNNAAVLLSGDVTPARAFQVARERFDHWKRQPDPFAGSTPYEVPALQHSSAVIIKDKVPDALLLVEWQGPSVTSNPRDTYAADVLSGILNAPGSTFHQRLVDSGLFTSCTVGYLTRTHVGPIILTARTSLDMLIPALSVLADQLQHLDGPDAFTDEELADVHQASRVELALRLEHPLAVAHEIATFWSSTGLEYFRTYTDEMANVTRADLQGYAKRYIVAAPMAVGVLAPEASGDSLRMIVAGFLPRS
jgi:zinc protease